IRGDDLEFHTAVREWSKIIENGDSEGYKKQFEETKAFFADRLEEGMKKSDELIKMLSENAA
ncbi:MAG TPA: prephenate dehydrogenase, partial [archaeon]|nr:prephenate dehydrogenase [archaeon]